MNIQSGGVEIYPCGNSCGIPGHDPSALQRTADSYFVTLVSGSGGGDAFGMRYLDPSNYTAGWMFGEYSYLQPEWVEDWLYPNGCDGKACPFWAPDLVTSGNGISPGDDNFIMYYSIADYNTYGRACIGRAKGSFNPSTSPPSIDWEDSGAPVVCSNVTQVSLGGPHAIDPSVSVDEEGRWWLSMGSWSDQAHVGPKGGGVWVVELDSNSGMLGPQARAQCSESQQFGNSNHNYPSPFCWSLDNTGFKNIANNPCVAGSGQCPSVYDDSNSIEASYLYRRTYRSQRELSQTLNYYYLFINYYYCCRGSESTYEIHVGRSTTGPAGPFLDRNGRDLQTGGGTLLLSLSHTSSGEILAGPGHAGILELQTNSFKIHDNSSEFPERPGQDRDLLNKSSHAHKEEYTYVFTFDYQGVGEDIEYAPQCRELSWDEQGWPVIGNQAWFPI